MNEFKIAAPFEPAGDQPKAIEHIVDAFKSGQKHHVLLGVTGSGKTFTMAKVIAELNAPTLIIAPNKTLAAQLYSELRALFPHNAVGFFISYYDYYQPEAYVPSTDTYIEKDASINEDIEKMRHASTRCLFEEKYTVVVASVSCIYGLGSPQAYASLIVNVEVGQTIERNTFLRSLIGIQYKRNDFNLVRGHFRVRGDIVDVLPAHQTDEAVRVEFFGDSIENISLIDALTGETRKTITQVALYPNSHYVADRKDLKGMVNEILHDLGDRLRTLKAQNKLVEYQRLEQRVMRDVETLEQMGFCPGIENYSRYLTGAKPGEPPPCLLNYFPDNFLTIIDESHITVPQIRAMYRGDRSRKQVLVDFGFRLPSALDNRPLQFEEFMEHTNRILYVSATPGPYELETSDGPVTEQIIRPTGLVDPPIEIRPVRAQVDDLLGTIRSTVANQGRVLVTTLTKRMAEDLTTYYADLGIRVKYLHSDIAALERSHLLRGLRRGDFDVLVGINLLREGLDLPEVKLVAVMDADKEGFLRSHTSLIQIVGRAARNQEAKVIFYADRITDSMKAAIGETDRRRARQEKYNAEHGITARTIIKPVPSDLMFLHGLMEHDEGSSAPSSQIMESLQDGGFETKEAIEKLIAKKSKAMKAFAGQLEFEKAAKLRDEVKELKGVLLLYGEDEAANGT